MFGFKSKAQKIKELADLADELTARDGKSKIVYTEDVYGNKEVIYTSQPKDTPRGRKY